MSNNPKPVIGITVELPTPSSSTTRLMSPFSNVNSTENDLNHDYFARDANMVDPSLTRTDSRSWPIPDETTTPTAYVDPSNKDNPRSCFYAHRTTTTDRDQARIESQSRLSLYGPTDSANQSLRNDSNTNSRENFHASKPVMQSQQSNHKHSRTASGNPAKKLQGTSVMITDIERNSVWPSRRELEEKALLAKRHRVRNSALGRWWVQLEKKQKLWVKIAIALFVLAAAVGIGVGISIAVKGGYYTGNGQSKPIPDPDNPNDVQD